MKKIIGFLFCLLAVLEFQAKAQQQPVSFKSLLFEMTQDAQLARFPEPVYKTLQASSYNRASVSPDKPGWFADGDGTGYIRQDTTEGRKEYVIMEHDGPGCITRMWTPYFYYSLENHEGPRIRIYIDGKEQPALADNFIKLLTGKSFIRPPFANLTTRAGLMYLPIPFSKSCKVTLDEKPFYYCINYRAYPLGSKVESFSMDVLEQSKSVMNKTASDLCRLPKVNSMIAPGNEKTLQPNDSVKISLPAGNHAIRDIQINVDTPLVWGDLRNILLKISFDGHDKVWCPLGDFFCSPGRVNNFHTKFIVVKNGNIMISRWLMPYRSHAEIQLVNYSGHSLRFNWKVQTSPWKWDNRSMYFHATWRNYGILQGNKFSDLNFVHITGKGLIVGDALTVLSPGKGWWGEGDEKIYTSKADLQHHFPSLFGTGTEDYYGWAGGIVPSGKDTFSLPFGSNVRNGNADNPRGYNICVRNRMLDAIPFEDELRFDMEASPGVDIRHSYDLLSYSMITYWYSRPGEKSNGIRDREKIKHRLMSLFSIDQREQQLKAGQVIPGSEQQ